MTTPAANPNTVLQLVGTIPVSLSNDALKQDIRMGIMDTGLLRDNAHERRIKITLKRNLFLI